jgi:hypothetical protein
MVKHVNDQVRQVVTLKYIDQKRNSFTAALAARQIFATTNASQGPSPTMAKRQDKLFHPQNLKEVHMGENIRHEKRIVPARNSRESFETFRNSGFCRESDFDDELCSSPSSPTKRSLSLKKKASKAFSMRRSSAGVIPPQEQEL